MFRKFFSVGMVFVASCVLVLATSCVYVGGDNGMPSKKLVITEVDNTKLITVKAKDVITVQLNENATTGYSWAFDGLDDTLIELQKSEFVSEATGSEPAVGSGGQMRWLLRAKAAGKTKIKMKLWRSWEGDSSIAKRFEFEVKITAK